MSDMTTAESQSILSEIRDLRRDMDERFELIEAKVGGLPDKAAIYTASLAIHGVIWATILGTIVVLNTFGAFR